MCGFKMMYCNLEVSIIRFDCHFLLVAVYSKDMYVVVMLEYFSFKWFM